MKNSFPRYFMVISVRFSLTGILNFPGLSSQWSSLLIRSWLNHITVSEMVSTDFKYGCWSTWNATRYTWASTWIYTASPRHLLKHMSVLTLVSVYNPDNLYSPASVLLVHCRLQSFVRLYISKNVYFFAIKTKHCMNFTSCGTLTTCLICTNMKNCVQS